MAYGNWGAIVEMNGERQPGREDQTPWREDELEAGYWQAWGMRDGLGPHHAVIGSGDVRLCIYKSYPVLYVRGKKIDLDQFASDETDDLGDPCLWSGEVEGWELQARKYNGNMCTIHLVKGDERWEATGGYAYGAGFFD